MRMTSTDRRLSQILDETAREFGFEEGHGRFKQYRFFQYKWNIMETMTEGQRARSLGIDMTDYLRCAPEFVIREYAAAAVDRIADPMGVSFRSCSEEFSVYLDSKEFLDRGRTIYMERSHTLAEDCRDGIIADVMGWLDENGLIPERARDAKVVWDNAIRRSLSDSTTNIMFKVVEIPSMLRDRQYNRSMDITWLVYRQLCNMATPFDPIGLSHVNDADELYKRFPEDLRKAAERQLQMEGLWTRDMVVE